LKSVIGSIIEKAVMMTDEERVRILSEAKLNSWVAFSSDESKLVGRGDSYEQAVEDAQKHGESDPLLIKIPDNWEPRVFHLCA
jgi:predicted RNase H-like HicB family nuclease